MLKAELETTLISLYEFKIWLIHLKQQATIKIEIFLEYTTI